MGGPSNKSKEKKRKKGQNSPGENLNQPQTKKPVMAASTPPPGPGPIYGFQQASPFTNYGYTPQYCLQNTPVGPFPNTPAQPNQVNQVNQGGTSEDSIMGKILERLETMDKKLSRLDSIQSSVNMIQMQVTKMDERIVFLEQKVSGVENSRGFDSDTMDKLEKKQAEIDRLLGRIQTIQKEQTIKEQETNTELIDLKCRSMRDNLVFYNFPEERDEDCANKILTFIEETMKVTNAKEEIKLHRAHRMGKYYDRKSRPIVAKFAYFPDRERVRKATQALKGTLYGVSQQFPREIQEKRKALVPIMKKAKEEGKDAYINVDKLYINGHLYRANMETA